MNTLETTARSHDAPSLPGQDECIFRLRRALGKGRLKPDEWAFNFTRSVLRHSKRADWVPSPKQLESMRRVLTELAAPNEDLIDDGGDHD